MPPNVNRELPEELKEQSERLEREGLIALYTERFEESERYFREQYALLESAQSRLHRPIHKGSPLHNAGIVGKRRVLEIGPGRLGRLERDNTTPKTRTSLADDNKLIN
jgi:hypothetical protein